MPSGFTQKVRDAVKTQGWDGRALRIEEIAEAMGIPKGHGQPLRMALHGLFKAGEIERVSLGVYRIGKPLLRQCHRDNGRIFMKGGAISKEDKGRLLDALQEAHELISRLPAR